MPVKTEEGQLGNSERASSHASSQHTSSRGANQRGTSASSEQMNNYASNSHDERRLMREKYGENALKIARYALIAHSSGKPIKRRDLIQVLKPVNGDLSRNLFQRYLKHAKEFLRHNLGMTIVELGPVKLRGAQWSPARDEFMVVSLSHSYRSMFHKVVPRAQLHEWGVTCFALMLIVLKGDGISYSDLCASFIQAKLHEASNEDSNDERTNDDETIRNTLQKTMQKLVAQRVFETIKSNKRAAPSEGDSAAPLEAEDIYFIGPYAKYLVNSRELYQMILRLHYPKERPNTPEFREQYMVAIRSLRQKFENTCLGSIGAES